MKPTTKRTLALIAVGVLPLLTVILGTVLLLCGTILTFSFFFTYFLIPAIAFALCVFLLRTRWKAGVKALTCIVLAVAYLWGLGHCAMFCHYALKKQWTGEEAISQYQADCPDHIHFFPESSELGEPEQVLYQFFYDQLFLFFDTETYALMCRYSESDYLTRCAGLDDAYVFQQEPLTACGVTVDPAFDLDGFRFRFLSVSHEESYNLWYPKSVALIGVNDETNQIVWLYYEDYDLDYLTDPANQLVEFCGWNYLR